MQLWLSTGFFETAFRVLSMRYFYLFSENSSTLLISSWQKGFLSRSRCAIEVGAFEITFVQVMSESLFHRDSISVFLANRVHENQKEHNRKSSGSSYFDRIWTKQKSSYCFYIAGDFFACFISWPKDLANMVMFFQERLFVIWRHNTNVFQPGDWLTSPPKLYGREWLDWQWSKSNRSVWRSFAAETSKNDHALTSQRIIPTANGPNG